MIGASRELAFLSGLPVDCHSTCIKPGAHGCRSVRVSRVVDESTVDFITELIRAAHETPFCAGLAVVSDS